MAVKFLKIKAITTKCKELKNRFNLLNGNLISY